MEGTQTQEVQRESEGAAVTARRRRRLWESEGMRRWGEREIWNQLGDWAEVACIAVVGSQAEGKETGPGCECCAMSECVYINTSLVQYAPARFDWTAYLTMRVSLFTC